tara:strand:+ start:125 stop:982 length:858 start_codon:yes stop_codon:yes gene_type:complete
MPTVSVVIPTFNRENFIEKSVTSVMAQTRQPDEIIVVDDGSDDNTWSVLKDIGFSQSASDKNTFRYILQTNKGVSSARNVGIEASRHDYIALLDSDDVWQKNKLEKQLISLEKQEFCFRLSHTDEIWVRNGVRVNSRKKHAKTGGDIFVKCLKLCCISPSSTLIHRSVFEDFGYFDETLPACEDYDFWLRFCAYENVHYLDEPLLIKVGGHDGQLSNAHWGMDRFRIYALEKLLRDHRLESFKRQETLKEVLFRLEVLINGSHKRNKTTFAQEMMAKKSYWEGVS